MNRTNKFIYTSLAALIVFVSSTIKSSSCFAGDDDYGTWTSITIEKKFKSKWSAEFWGEYRSRDKAGSTDRWVAEIRGIYKPVKYFSVTLGYMLLYDHNKAKFGKDDIGSYTAPSYYGFRHRFSLKLNGNYQIDNISISLREWWQYTYRGEKNIPCHYDESGEPRQFSVHGTGKNVLRSMLTITYKIPDSRFSPFVSGEIFNSWKYTEGRYKAGTGIKIDAHNSLQVYYMLNDFKTTPSRRHILGLGYKYSF